MFTSPLRLSAFSFDFVDELRGSSATKCRELPVSVECPVSAHQSTLSIKRAIYRTNSANTSRDYAEIDISRRVAELCPRQSTCRFDLAAGDVTRAQTTQRAARRLEDHIDISYSCQSSASAIIQPTDYHPGNDNQGRLRGWFTAQCELRGCKNIDPLRLIPGRMSYKATKPGLICLSYISIFIVLLFIRVPF